jgi:Spy/CpxP family protein refolding chaperone
MKLAKLLLLSLAFMASFASMAAAAEPAKDSAEHAAKAEKVLRGNDKIAEELGLSDEQKAKFKAIKKEENAALKVVSEDKSLERAAKIAKNKEIREAHRAQVRALLTPEQQAKFDAMKSAKDAAKDDKEQKE